MTKDRLGKNKKRKSASQISYPQLVFAKASPGFGSPDIMSGARKRGRRLETTACRLEHRVRRRQYAVSNFLWRFFAYCLLLVAYWLYLPTVNCQLSTAFADEIKIRTIVTPIGSQSELGDLLKGQV